MKIVLSLIPYDGGKSGISVYMREVLAELERRQVETVLVVEHSEKQTFPGHEVIAAPEMCSRAWVSMFWHLFALPFILRKRKFDACILAAANRRALAFYPVQTVAVVHDLAQYHVKGKYDLLRTFYLKHVLPFFVRRAHTVAAISRSTLNDLIRYWKVPAEQIVLDYNGLSLAKPALASSFLKKHNLSSKGYILYISRIEHPGKNHLNLIKAYERLPAHLRERYKLALVGADWHGAETVHAYAGQSASRDRIVFCGFAESGELAEAYTLSALYVFPSFFEGFGLSLIEAMYYGVPTCASNVSSLKEIGEGASLLFDPSEPDAIASAMSNLLDDKVKASEAVAAGYSRAAEFTWEKHVETLLKAVGVSS